MDDTIAPSDETLRQNDDVSLLKTLADATRLRLVRLLRKEELNVQELSRILQVAQPSVSRHLAVLRAAGLVTDRREGTRVYYELQLPKHTRQTLRAFIEDLGSATAHPDMERLDEVLGDRAREATDFADRSAACWDDVGKLLHQSSALLTAFADLAPRERRVADFGTGTGLLLPFLSKMADRVMAVDQSGEMLRRARRRCEQQALTNVSLVHKSLEELDPSDGTANAGLLHFVLHQVASPATVLQRLSRVLAADGRLVIVDRLPHQDREAERLFGSLWLGFSEHQMREWSEQANFRFADWRRLPSSESAAENDDAFVTLLVRAN